MLTQLAFLETLESNITKESVLMLCKPNKCFFNEMIMEMNELSVRKLLYTFSKFYARDILNEDIKLIKNTLHFHFNIMMIIKRTLISFVQFFQMCLLIQKYLTFY